MKKHFPIIFFLCLFFTVFSVKQVVLKTPFYDWDESLYMQSGKEMIDNKYFLAPMWQGTPWLDKPPLIPLLYATVTKIVFFIPPEISARILTVCVATIVLLFSYLLYYPIFNNSWLTTLATLLTSMTPIFFQRAQVVNLDIFVLFGWLGYLLFYKHFWLSILFLLVSVLSKSLIGFYPVGILGCYYVYLFVTKNIPKKVFLQNVKKLLFHILIASLWFIMMFVLYGKQFYLQHIIESHFRRVSSSIEFHFGKRTFYLDLAWEQFGLLVVSGIVGSLSMLYLLFKKKIKPQLFLYSLYLLPWYLFLNATKTKIFWYMVPAVPQIAFLIILPLLFFKRKKILFYLFSFMILLFILYNGIVTNKALSTTYASYDEYYQLSQYAKQKCSALSILLNNTKRKDFDTLDKLGLLITTTKWWGDRPSIVYYFGKKVDFIYDVPAAEKILIASNNDSCFVKEEQDDDVNPESFSWRKINSFGKYILYIQ